MKREWRLRKPCVEPGCTAEANYKYDTKRDMMDSWASKHDYRCTRHSDKNSVLSIANQATESVLFSVASVEGSKKLFWGGHNGFMCGPGFKAFADDFPPGTKLVVTARIELPLATKGTGNG